MKKISLFVVLLLFISCSTKKKIRYFYEFEREISKSEFNKIHRQKNVLLLTGDSIHHKVLVNRRVEGTIQNRSVLNQTFSELTKSKIDPLKPLVIIYDPGNDPFNSDSKERSDLRHDKEFIRIWKEDLLYGVQKLTQTEPIFIRKSKEGIDKFSGLINWHLDTNGVIERLFFKKYYPPFSFVIINTDGYFISYYGEFHLTQVWKAIQELYP